MKRRCFQSPRPAWYEHSHRLLPGDLCAVNTFVVGHFDLKPGEVVMVIGMDYLSSRFVNVLSRIGLINSVPKAWLDVSLFRGRETVPVTGV